MADIISIVVLLLVLIPAIYYIVKEKKKGHACIGCPNASNCSRKGHCTK